MTTKGLTTTGTYRNVVELSVMSNNDEFIFYSKGIGNLDDLKSKFRFGHFDYPKIVLSRPVFKIEIEEGLDTTFCGRRESLDGKSKEEIPEVTYVLDACFKIKNNAEAIQEICGDKFNASSFLSHYVACHYYDCMSVGFPLYELLICRQLVKGQ